MYRGCFLNQERQDAVGTQQLKTRNAWTNFYAKWEHLSGYTLIRVSLSSSGVNISVVLNNIMMVLCWLFAFQFHNYHQVPHDLLISPILANQPCKSHI